MDLHPDVAVLAGLLGTWRGTGRGSYPTIDDFEYHETVTFGSVGKPNLAYRQATTSPDGAPMHAESGYLRGVGDGRVEWTIAQPSGLVEVDPGTVTVTDEGLVITVASSLVGVSPTAKQVDAVQRTFRLRGDELSYDLSMAAVGVPMTHHLSATLQRVRD